MTVTMAVEKTDTIEVALEWEKPGILYARVYEKYGDEWHQTYESRPYPVDEEDNARNAYKRFVKKYLKENKI